MILHERAYREWIRQRGVGAHDVIASSPDSYVSYLNSVSDLLGVDISPAILASEEDVVSIAETIEGQRAPATINNYKSAMRQYVAMVAGMRNFGEGSPSAARPSVATVQPLQDAKPPSATEHNLHSSYREMLLEHLFAAEVMRHLWLRGNSRIEMLKPQVDDSGYDLVLESNGVVRHVQLKSSHHGSSTSDVKVSLSLAKKPSGCVIWLWFDPANLALGPFLWFGSDPGCRLPELEGLKIAKHAKGNAQGVKLERPNVRVIPKNRFEPVPTIDEIVLKLFGPRRDEAAT